MHETDYQVLFIAEISANHLGSFERAKELVIKAAQSGATAIKFQTYTPDTMTLDLPHFSVSEGHDLWGGRSLYDLYKEAMTPWEWHSELFALTKSLGVIPFSSPFDATAVEFLEEIGCSIYKIASMETGDIPLIKRIGETGKPTIMSTGATEYDEIAEAVEAYRSTGNTDLTLLVCTSSYPADPRDANIKRMEKLQKDFNVKVGLSDHTLGIGVSLGAIALGATVIEKHFTLRRSDGGADGAFSMEPHEFQQLVKEGKAVKESLGVVDWKLAQSESESRRLRRSLYITADVRKGDLITKENLRSIRPGSGCEPKHYESLLGKRFKSNFSIGTPMKIEYSE